MDTMCLQNTNHWHTYIKLLSMDGTPQNSNNKKTSSTKSNGTLKMHANDKTTLYVFSPIKPSAIENCTRTVAVLAASQLQLQCKPTNMMIIALLLSS